MRCSAHHIIASCETGSASNRALASASPGSSEIELTEARTFASSAVTMKLASVKLRADMRPCVQLSAGKRGSGSSQVLVIKYDAIHLMIGHGAIQSAPILPWPGHGARHQSR